MRSLAEALLGDDNGACPEAEQISGTQAQVCVAAAAPHSPAARRTEACGASLPIVALRASGDGVRLAHVLARVLVRRALVQEGAIGAVVDCASPTALR